MTWFWTDDIARALIEQDVVGQDQMTEWLHRPVAVAAEEELDLVELGKRLLGLCETSLDEAGAA